jgi:streptomycin 3"-adenylyltransferase
MLWKGNKTLHYNNILKIIKQEYQTILGDNLVGIYVHGSIAFGCFHEEKSDIDFIAVI